LAGLLAVAIGFITAGCGGPELYDVSGTVTYDGKSLPAGVIYFDPDVLKNNKSSQGYAVIKDGAYDTAAKGGKPVVGGSYLARIEGFDGKPGKELPMGKSLFTNFQKAIELPRATSTQDFYVSRKKRSGS
jgi:hypothetical protein